MSDLQHSKLIAGYVTKLEPEDFKKFGKFLESSYHNSRQILIPFFKIIQQRNPDFGHKNFTAEKVHQKLYPGKEYNEKIFQNRMTEMIRRIEDYLVHEEIMHEQTIRDQLLNKAFSRRNQFLTFRNRTMDNIKNLQGIEQKNLKDYHAILQHAHDLFFHPEMPRDSKSADDCMTQCMEALDCFYFLSKATYSIEILTRNHLRNEKRAIILLEESLRHGKETDLCENELFKFYSLLIAFLKAKDDNTYNILKNYLFKECDEIPEEGQRLATTVMVNFAYAQYLGGKATYLQEFVMLNEFRDEQDLFVINDRIPKENFINVIVTMAACGHFEWATFFQDKYAGFLKAAEQEDVLCLSRAYIHFHSKEYLDVIAELKDIENRPQNISLRLRSLSIRAYYELSLDYPDYEVEAERAANNLIAFLPNKKIAEKRRAAYHNFCRICLDLLGGKRENALKKLKEKEHVMFRKWLVEKVEALSVFGV